MVTQKPRDIIRAALPLKGMNPDEAGQLVEACFQAYKNDKGRGGPSLKKLRVHIHMARESIKEAMENEHRASGDRPQNE